MKLPKCVEPDNASWFKANISCLSLYHKIYQTIITVLIIQTNLNTNVQLIWRSEYKPQNKIICFYICAKNIHFCRKFMLERVKISSCCQINSKTHWTQNTFVFIDLFYRLQPHYHVILAIPNKVWSKLQYIVYMIKTLL